MWVGEGGGCRGGKWASRQGFYSGPSEGAMESSVGLPTGHTLEFLFALGIPASSRGSVYASPRGAVLDTQVKLLRQQNGQSFASE